jgi:cell division protein FtsW (lipid II flippase)
MSSLRKALFYRIDGIILMIYVMLVFIGIATVFSVEHRTTDTALIMMNKNYMKQFIWFGYSLATRVYDIAYR